MKKSSNGREDGIFGPAGADAGGGDVSGAAKRFLKKSSNGRLRGIFCPDAEAGGGSIVVSDGAGSTDAG